VLVYTYNIYGKSDFKVDEIVKADYLLNPIRIYEYPNTRGRGAWKIVGKTDLIEKDIPFFKDTVTTNLINVEDESKIEDWRYKKNFNELFQADSYEQVAHLEHQFMLYKEIIVLRATMEIIRLRGEKVESYYDLTNENLKWEYLRAINIPFIKDIPLEYRGKLIPPKVLKDIKGIPFRSQ